MSNCSTVPRSRSLIIEVDETSEPLSISRMPKVPVTVNQLVMSAGLNRNAGRMVTVPRRVPALVAMSELRVETAVRQRLVPALDHALGIALTDRGSVGVHGVEQNLNVRRVAALQIFVEVVWYRQAGIEFAARHRVAEFLHGAVGTGELEAAALGHVRDQIAALDGMIVVDDAELQMADRRIECEAEEHKLQDRRHDERDREATVAADLREFLADQGAQPR